MKRFLRLACLAFLLAACDSGREDEFELSGSPPDVRAGFFEARAGGAVLENFGGFAQTYEMGPGTYAVRLVDTTSTTRFLIVTDTPNPSPGLYSVASLNKRDSTTASVILIYTGQQFENIIEADGGTVRFFQSSEGELVGRFSLLFSRPIPEFRTGSDPVRATGSFHTRP